MRSENPFDTVHVLRYYTPYYHTAEKRNNGYGGLQWAYGWESS